MSQPKPPKTSQPSPTTLSTLTSLTSLNLHQDLKKHLRIQICQKLKQKDLIKKQQPHQDKLYNRIMASLVSQYLVKTDCGYSNSVFVSQSGYEMKILGRGEILEIFGIGEGEGVGGDGVGVGEESVLDWVMKRKYPFNGGTYRAVSVQTNPQQIGYTLEQRLALIDQQYRKNLSNPTSTPTPIPQQSQKLSQLQQTLKKTYERDVARFKQFQTHAIKVKVSQEWRKKFEQYAAKLSEEYRGKMDYLRKKERLLSDDIVNRSKVLDGKVHGAHKTFLQKIQVLDIKATTIDETKKNLQIQRKRARQEYSVAQQQLQKKTREYDNLLLNLNSKIEYQVGIAKLAIQQEYQQKNSEFLARKKYIDEEYGKLMGIKETTDLIKEENRRLADENGRLRKDLVDLEKEFRVAVTQSGNKGDRLDSLRGEIFKVQKQLKQKQQALNDISKKYRKKQEQIVELRRQLDDLRAWKQKNEKHQQSSIDFEQNQNPRTPPVITTQGSKTQIQLKMDQLKKQRKRQIQRLKLQLLS